MRQNVRISRGIEPLFGTRDENIRLLEENLGVVTRLKDDAFVIEGEEPSVMRACQILEEYVTLVENGHVFVNGDLHDLLRVVARDPGASLRGLIESGRQRNFGKKTVTPKSLNQRVYLDAIERHDLVFGIGP